MFSYPLAEHMEQNDSSCIPGAAQEVHGPNVWIMPLPYVTHVNCFYHFALQLASQGLTVTFFTMDNEIQRLQTSENGILRSSWKREGRTVRFRSCGSVTDESDVGSSTSVQRKHLRVLPVLETAEKSLVKFMRSECECGKKPTCFISDLWYVTAREVATECGIPAWLMSPYSVGYLSLITYLNQLESKGIVRLPNSPDEKESQDELVSIPGLPLLRIREIPYFYFRSYPAYAIARRNGESVPKCDVVLLSSFYELDGRSFREFEGLMKALAIKNGRKIPHIWNVGPTFDFLSYVGVSKVDELGDEAKHHGIKFLDSQAASSVLLVIFGTLVNHSQEQIVEIARGLENNEQPFICVLNAPVLASGIQGDDVFSVIPADCVKRTRGRGLFLQGWVPQLKLLAHPATGAFISHCGQNSLLESLSLGVPILAWPHTSDQFMNCRFLVEESQVALEVRRGPNGFVDRKELERSVKALFHSEEGRVVREKAQEMGESAKRTVGENGMTRRNIQSLVALIRGL